MKFNSINNFEVTINNDDCINIAKKNITDVISPVEESNSNRIRETKPIIGGEDDECTEMAETWYSANNFMWLGTILISFTIWTTCIVSLVIVALILQIVVEIVAFLFCFSKSHKNYNANQ